MRHRKKKIELNKSKGHIKSLLRNLLTSLVKHGEIKTTAAKAKMVRREAEKLIARSIKRDEVHAIRQAKGVFFEPAVAKKFFQEYLPLAKKRQSGFVSTMKLGNREGDNAAVVLVKLIDYKATPETPKAEKETKAKKTTTTKKAAPKKKAAKKETAKKATTTAK